MRPQLAALAAVLVLASTGVATPACTPTTTAAHLDTGDTPAGRFYYSEDCGLLVQPCLLVLSAWIYEESNGIPGLQRQDEVHDDTCGGAIAGDSIIL